MTQLLSKRHDRFSRYVGPTYFKKVQGWQYFKGMDVPHCRKNVIYVCYEGLRSIKQAEDMAGLNEDDINVSVIMSLSFLS